MTKFVILTYTAFTVATTLCAQQEPSTQENPPTTTGATADANPTISYTPPTHADKFHTYLHHTFGVPTFIEAGARAGIDQARDAPSQWPEGAEGYAERFGSAFGGIAVRGTIKYSLSELFHEDPRDVSCRSNCSKVVAALQDTFTARKGEDGHRVFSVARVFGPIAAGAVVSAWHPDGFGKRNLEREIGLNFGFEFARNLIRQLVK